MERGEEEEETIHNEEVFRLLKFLAFSYLG